MSVVGVVAEQAIAAPGAVARTAGGVQATALAVGDVGERLLDRVLVLLVQADRPDVLADVAGLLVVGALAGHRVDQAAAIAASRRCAAELGAGRAVGRPQRHVSHHQLGEDPVQLDHRTARGGTLALVQIHPRAA